MGENGNDTWCRQALGALRVVAGGGGVLQGGSCLVSLLGVSLRPPWKSPSVIVNKCQLMQGPLVFEN